jgi:hypothetical protein
MRLPALVNRLRRTRQSKIVFMPYLMITNYASPLFEIETMVPHLLKIGVGLLHDPMN